MKLNFLLLIFVSIFTNFSIMANDYKVEVEAENLQLSDSTEIKSKAFASGGQFVKILTGNPTGSITLALNDVPESGLYKLQVYSFNDGTTQNLNLSINGETATSITLLPSNWAFEDSSKVSYFDVNLNQGDNTITLSTSLSSVLIDKIAVTSHFNVFYFSNDGNDSNDGSYTSPWQTIDKATAVAKTTNSGGLLTPGSKLLFKSGDTFEGEFLVKCSGTSENPIEISSYGSGEFPILSGSGSISGGDYFEAIRVINASHLLFTKLWIKNDRQNNTRYTYGEYNSYGIKVIANKWGGVSSDLTFRDLKFSDIFGVGVPDEFNDYSVTGLRFESEQNEPDLEVSIKDVLIEDCYFTHLGKAGVWAVHKGSEDLNDDTINRNHDFVIRNNTFYKTGGSGVILSKMLNAMVENNDFDHSGHSQASEGRLAGRGSGMWVFKCVNIVGQYNRSISVRGPNDSYGMHIDFGNKNIIYQYNYSEDSEGGFVEVLGDNHNVAYRFNVSVNDGLRDYHGSTIWTSGYVGTDNTPVPSDDVYVYNNTIYLGENQKPDFSIFSEDTYIYNNIFVQTGSGIIGENVDIDIQNNGEFIVSNNLFQGNINTAFSNLDQNKLSGSPLFTNQGAKNIEGYQIQSSSPVIDAGKSFPEPVFPEAGKGIFKNFDITPLKDIYGNEVGVDTYLPNIGADNNYNNKIDPSLVQVEGIQISAQTSPLYIGETLQLSKTITPSNASNQNVTWSSSNDNILTVDQNGLVTAVAEGSAVITVETEQFGKKATTSVNVGEEITVNLLNGDFENGMNNWGSWANASISSNSYYGNSALQLTAAASIKQWVKVKPNTTYTLSAWAKVNDPENDRVVFGVNDEKDKGISNLQIYDTDYTLQQLMFTTSSSTDSVKVFFWRPANGVGNSFVDEIQLNETAHIINTNFNKGILGWNPWGSGTVANVSNQLKLTGYCGANQYIKTKPNTTYEISFVTKVDDPSVKVNFLIAENGGSTYVSKDIYDTSWTNYTLTFTTDASSEDTRIGFWRPNNSTGGAYLDELSIVETSSARFNTSLEEELSFDVFPNPATNQVKISTNTEHTSFLTVYNLIGKIEKTQTFKANTTIDVSRLETGLYIVVIIDSLGNKKSSKLVIK